MLSYHEIKVERFYKQEAFQDLYGLKVRVDPDGEERSWLALEHLEQDFKNAVKLASQMAKNFQKDYNFKYVEQTDDLDVFYIYNSYSIGD